ncbi:FBD-associated F-box protein [Corchorus olitorius]|uniref:FBD-associated F-box protein n=1 Tax=Corchorus olitorius TaxID=93759 RepID=A0A1R3L1U3_9ROSI|nr:FBD-associated F-box protein [Corchorus olitorius]
MLQCPPLPNLRYLTCDVLVVERSSSMGLLRLTPLIHAAPYLHKFKLNIEVTKDAPIELEEREIGEVLEFVARKIDYNYFPNEKLREVEIVGFLGSKPEIELLTYLLKTALEVNKIVINTLPPRVSLGTPALRKERKAPERWKAIQFVRKLGRQQLGLESDEARAVD